MQASSVVSGTLLSAETFSILTISPPFIINVIFSVVALMAVFYFRSESWKGRLLNMVVMMWSLFFISVYVFAWYVRLKNNITPDFAASFAPGPFPGWKELIAQSMEEPDVTGNAITYAAFLFLTRKYNDWYMWPVKIVFIFFVGLFFVKYIPVVFHWLIG
ncbi:hypothetical protein EVJ27_05665 [Exiguobacterium sp. SH3S2]|uniref:hypothetical protein n=1 Tax=unclassified Exiguobacterium TaxID=2644629 RepID=UPI00103DE8FD|nr:MULTISPECIES: hypothetical protein [unclassified Exiguobacterium]TCI57116.1 hypothetical protein EVJ30_02375 [Exiguobacterium sp. SH5S13]TCI62030.1 hypothetical protein EVJ27_05665 [Exiguobacterium sp. SH3S2]TCI62708.1 hypothetical protein EVJ26_07315 [Exiguobacterium sp. SH3S1]